MNQEPFKLTRVATRVRKFIAKRDRKTQENIEAAFTFISTISPFHHPNSDTIKPLHGNFAGHMRYRIGKIRIVHKVNESDHTIAIIGIDNRGDVYK